jgi:hypothetical protein
MDSITRAGLPDPERPRAERQFEGVTATLTDPYRGLIYLTNADGLWILRMEPATDVELEREYEKQILYNH